MRRAACLCAAGVLAALLAAACLAEDGTGGPAASGTDLQVRILQTRDDADCIILHQGANAVMIDTGEAQDGRHVIQTLQDTDIRELDALILTHPDKDHIGGALSVLETIPVDQVFHPYYDEEKETLTAIEAYCEAQGIPVRYPDHVWKLDTGYVSLLIYPPQEKHYKQDNNYSLAVLAEHGEVKMFFGGDALKKRSEELLAAGLPKVALYKVAHHGRANGASEALFEALDPDYAVVTSDRADEEILESAEKCGSRLLFSREAEVVFQSDGKRLTLWEQGGPQGL